MPRKLTREEQETVITFDESSPTAMILTYNKAWQTRLEKVLRLKPTMKNDHGGREYELPKKLLSVRQPRTGRKLSDAQKDKLRKQLATGRKKKSILPSNHTLDNGV